MNRSQFNEALEKLERAPAKKQVLQLVLAGHTDPEIALTTGTKPGTVRKHISNIYQSFGIKGEYKGDRRSRRDELVAQFRKYKSEWVSDIPSAVNHEKTRHQLAKGLGITEQELLEQIARYGESEDEKTISAPPGFAESEEAIAKPQRESEQPDTSSIEERIFKATEQLNCRGFSALVGIQALEEIAKDSPRYHWKIMELLATFVRNAPRRKEEESIPDDIQAALTVIGQRNPEKDPTNKRLDLSHTEIRGANLQKANLQGVILTRANLQAAILSGSSLQRVDLNIANLGGADLEKTNLEKANLHRADLREAELCHAHLQSANLKYTDLTAANLAGANLQFAKLEGANLHMAYLGLAKLQGTKLQGVKNLELKQIEKADGDATTVLPNYLQDQRPSHWT
jgi:uncharacterized protein YjbI with pentapeptide repeats